MLQVIAYDDLEAKVHSGKETVISFRPDDQIQLRRGIAEGRHVVELIMPWGNIYKLGTYDDEASAKTDFERYDSCLRKGYAINITSCGTAQVLPPG